MSAPEPPPPPPPPGNGPPEGEITRYLQRVRAGDEKAFDALLEHTYARFRLLARKMLRGFPGLRRSEVETGDVVHQSYLALRRSLKNRTPDSSEHFLNFAAAVMRHKLIDLARKARRRRPQSGSSLDQLPGTLTSPEDLARRSEVHEALDRVTREHERLGEVVELHFYQGLTQEDTATVLKVDKKTVQRDWARALCLLRRYLNGGGD